MVRGLPAVALAKAGFELFELFEEFELFEGFELFE